jgi:Fe-S-cluster containining protein
MIKLKQIIPFGYCLRCTGCCRFSEARTIWSAHLLKQEQEKGQADITLIAHGDYYICALFNPHDNKCAIYKTRPFECRLYPFLLRKNKQSRYLSLDLKCPFVKENFNSKSFKEHCQYLSRLLNNPRNAKILQNNPQIFQAYPDVLDIAEI